MKFFKSNCHMQIQKFQKLHRIASQTMISEIVTRHPKYVVMVSLQVILLFKNVWYNLNRNSERPDCFWVCKSHHNFATEHPRVKTKMFLSTSPAVIPIIKCKIWYMNGSIFQNLAKFEPKLAQN